MAAIKDVVFDCARAAPLARFWAAVLDDYDVRPYDDEEIARLAEVGLTPETDPVVFVDGPGPNICFQQVPEGKTTKNRLHLDLTAADRRHEVERLIGLGASVYYEGAGWTTLQDPEGNEFCVADP
ncbi:MAG: VOC family protein [Actinomycetota bacterium]